jgi:Uma2 family endonuclease
MIHELQNEKECIMIETLERPLTFTVAKQPNVVKRSKRLHVAEQPDDDEFYYGYRYDITYDDNGEEIFIMVPLTPDDFMDPQEGDMFMLGSQHSKDTFNLFSIFCYFYHHNPAITIFSQLKMLWDVAGISQPAPDIAVVPNVKEPDKPRSSFDVQQEGTQPTFVLEVVFPRYRPDDLQKKVAVYQRVGIEEYFIIDSGLRERTANPKLAYEILGYRLQGGVYTRVQPNHQGWLYSQVNDLWLGVNEAKDAFFVIDGQTGAPILPGNERAEVEIKKRHEAEERAKQAEQDKAESIAHAMLAKGFEPAMIAELTGLSADQFLN